METWKPILGYEELYSASDHGRVRRELTRTCGVAGRIKKPHLDGYGYPAVCLSRPGDKQRNFTIHVLVWEAFNGRRPAGLTVNHKDGDKTNNRLGNLELLTHGDNVRHAINELGQDRRGAGNPASRLVEEQIVEMREARAGGEKFEALAARFGVSVRMVHNIVHGRSWANAPGPITLPRRRRS